MGSLGRTGLWVCGCVLALAAPAALAQVPGADQMGMPGGASSSGRNSSRGQQMPQQPLPPSPITPDAGPTEGKMEHDQAKLRNIDRQKQIVADTQKLVELANELQSDVQKSNKDTLSLDVIRKADEIEKLAKSVREKMKGS
ncbi:MAG TPA: hypothetical protein VJU82_00495 [Acidobacteriaceae bacterium]|nr:hypothetical protein [Acidobacteriaceae bacterium]